MPKSDATRGATRQKWPKRGKQPIVFAMQPTEYEMVPPEKLGEWEKALRTQVGFPAAAAKALAALRGVQCISFCPSFDD
jgi:hypothetical protein